MVSADYFVCVSVLVGFGGFWIWRFEISWVGDLCFLVFVVVLF